MKFSSLKQCVEFLKEQGEVVTIDTPVDPNLEMAEITRRVFDAGGPAILFSNVKNSKFPAVSNMFGTWERTLKIFEPQLERVTALVDVKSDPAGLLRRPGSGFKAVRPLLNAIPVKTGRAKVMAHTCRVGDLPMIRCWPKDGGGFILLPQVFSRDPESASVFNSNLGMYRIQLSGNDYIPGKEIGLHYQLHRGIGNHHKKALERREPLRVSIFIGGPPAHTLAAVMPLPEGVPEVAFAGALAGRNFRYAVKNQHLISADADFCITGIVEMGKTKKEGPFGDHLGYYSLDHPYPYLKVESVYHRRDAVFPFTVVGRPPQEDSNFGRLIHEITRSAVKDTIPGVSAVNAVDDAGVHPLLLAKARERYVPYEERRPRELLTHASMILGTGQLSLAKYLLICAHEDNPSLDVNDEKTFFVHLLERIDLKRDLHFITRTTMDTLDYSTQNVNEGSKLVMAAAGPKLRNLSTDLPSGFSLPNGFTDPQMAAPGMVVIKGPAFSGYPDAAIRMEKLKQHLASLEGRSGLPLVVVVDDAGFASQTFANFLWVTFLRSNPSHDLYGVNEGFVFKHWGCDLPMIIDARIKPFHSAVLEPDPATVKAVNDLGRKGQSLYGII